MEVTTGRVHAHRRFMARALRGTGSVLLAREPRPLASVPLCPVPWSPFGTMHVIARITELLWKVPAGPMSVTDSTGSEGWCLEPS